GRLPALGLPLVYRYDVPVEHGIEAAVELVAPIGRHDRLGVVAAADDAVVLLERGIMKIVRTLPGASAHAVLDAQQASERVGRERDARSDTRRRVRVRLGVDRDGVAVEEAGRCEVGD